MVEKIKKDKPVVEPVTRTGIEKLLDKYKIDHSSWGDGTTCTLARLVHTLNEEEVTLENRNNGQGLVLEMKVAVVMVKYKGRLGPRILFESSQLYHGSGTSLERDFEGIGETLKKGEEPIEAAKRALTEKLGQTEQGFRSSALHRSLNRPLIWKRSNPVDYSKKWPGLKVTFSREWFNIIIGDKLYRDKYTEVTLFEGKPYKTTTFRWKAWIPT